jgi:nifR3 family TIM-barrel protein
MSGVTCMAFRRLIKECNPGAVGLVVTEFISVEALTRNIKRSLDMMRYDETERPFSIQIFGYDPQRMRDAARMAQDAGADVVDINCGCPAPKVVRKGGGCELMRQPEHLRKVISHVRPAVTVPLTLKMRAGWDVHSINCVDVARMCESSGIDGLAVHGRTRTQMYRGDADWGIIKEVQRAVRIPVLGSGDVTDYASFNARVPPEGEDGPTLAGAMIGRGALQNPFVFTEIAFGKPCSVRGDEAAALAVMNRYAELLSEEFPPKVRIGKLKQLGSQMLRGFPWRKDLLLAPDFDSQMKVLAQVAERVPVLTLRQAAESLRMHREKEVSPQTHTMQASGGEPTYV